MKGRNLPLKPPLDLRRVTLGLVFLLILAMANQLQPVLPLGAYRLPIPIADVVLLLAFVGVILSVGSRKLRGLKLPPLQAWALVAVSVVALLRTHGRADAAKEIIQFVEYFLIAFFVFANVAETRDLRPFLIVFAVSTALAVGWAACQYADLSGSALRFVWAACRYANMEGSAFCVSAGYDNRNALGAFLALAVPMLYGLALYARHWPERILLLILVAGALLVDLSGASVLISLVVLAILSAIRGRRVLIAYLAVLGVVLVFAPRILPRPYHTDALFASVSPYVDDNFLLSDSQMVAQARELLEPRPLDADRLLRLLADRRLLHKRPPLSPEESRLQIEIKERIQAQVPAEVLQSYPLDRPQVAVRYQRWNAAIACIRSLWDRGPSDVLFGLGLTSYHGLLKDFMTSRLQYRTDLPEVYNIAAPEPFTYDVWFKTFIQMGLLGFLALAWLVGAFLGRAVALWRSAHSEFALGVALGSLGSILGFALGGLFTETIARGIAIPFVFILAAITVAERIVHGERKTALEQLTRVD